MKWFKNDTVISLALVALGALIASLFIVLMVALYRGLLW